MIRLRTIAWALSVGLVLADSSIVTLALPEILTDYDSGVFAVSWVLTAYNVVLAAAIFPLARFARSHSAELWSAGVAIFAIASAACAFAPSLEALIGFRCIQALGGAAAIAGAIELLSRQRGSHANAARVWGVAGTAGLVLGPAVGGALTQIFSWEAIFLVQIPALILLAATRAPEGDPEPGPEGKLDLRPEWALGLLSGGLTAALFLLVILLINGWGLSPLAAAGVVTVIPVAALLVGRIQFPERGAAEYAIGGAIATAGGLAALGVLPGAGAELTVAPQLLIGAGLALALPVLTAAALLDRDPEGTRAAATLAARHAGIVVGIVVLTPVLSLQLESQQEAGRDAGTALLLDAPLSPTTKVEVATGIGDEIDLAEQQGALPNIGRAFAQIGVEPEEQRDLDALQTGIEEQVERAATHAFTLPFLGAALLAALALIPLSGLRKSGA